MYYFFEKLVKVGLPRVRDFRGVSAHSFDGHGNYTLGIKEQLIFQKLNMMMLLKFVVWISCS